MRKTKAYGSMVQNSKLSVRALRLAAVALGIGLLMTAGVARAQDGEDEDERTFEEKIIDNIMSGIGGTNMEKPGIDYRERSPLVVPPKLDLPPPASSAEVKAPNWPKDPDEARRKAAIAARKKESAKDLREVARPLSPSELNVGRTAAPARTNDDPVQPGVTSNPMMSPAQLGYLSNLNIFGGNKSESKEFKGEPDRQSLTQPPAGYQTPSPKYMYGTGPKESLNKPCNVVAGDKCD